MPRSKESRSLGTILKDASKKALGGGLPGLLAMTIQVTTLMWMRTLVNYQYSNGGTFMEAFNALYADGGIGRFYKGYGFAMMAGPLARFGDTAANAGILALCQGRVTEWLATALASAGAALWRVFTQPVSNAKTLMQTKGVEGFPLFLSKMRANPLSMWDGALGTMGATWCGHYPWFLTYNLLEKFFPEEQYKGFAKLVRNAGLGFCASFVSDCVSNALRVITTVKIGCEGDNCGYMAVAASVIQDEGVFGLMGRGLGTKLISNGVSAMLFSVLWKYFTAKWAAQSKAKTEDSSDVVVESAVSTPSGRKSLRSRKTPTQFEPGGNPRVSDQPDDPKMHF